MKQPHVAIAVLCGTPGGPAWYGRRLVAALAATGEARLTVLTDAPPHFDGLAVDVVDVPMRGGLDRLRWQHVAVPRALRRVAPDVYHDTKNALPMVMARPAVVTVHDLAYHTVPESFGFWSRTFLRRTTRDAVRRARAVVVPSAATAHDLRRFHPEAAQRVHVVPHGIDPAPTVGEARRREVAQRLSLPDPYVLHVGTVQARKNVDLVVRAVRMLRAEGRRLRALVVGRRGWLAERAVAELTRDDTALWIEHVTSADLPAVYAGAWAFVSPSAYEGFGFAVADALAAGVPTIVADSSSLPELCGDAALRLPTLTAEAIAASLRRLEAEPELAAQLAERGRGRAAAFSWRASAEGHLRAYHAALRH